MTARIYRMSPGQLQNGLILTFLVAVVALVLAGAGLNQRVDHAVSTANQSSTQATEARQATCEFIQAFIPQGNVPPADTPRGEIIQERAARLHKLVCEGR